jgi:polyphenol oxidase
MQQTSWLRPEWPAPAGVRAVFTTRGGGCSLPPFDSLNLGDHVGDSPDRVSRNRSALRQALQAQPVFLQQVHGQHVVRLTTLVEHGVDTIPKADACISTDQGVACTIMVADCLPVLLTHLDAPVVAAAHAGWRGLVGDGSADVPGVVAAVMRDLLGCGPSGQRLAPHRTLAWLGPCIGPQAFEVGGEVKAVFEAWMPGASAFFAPLGGGKYLADLPGLAKHQLLSLGVTQIYGNDGSAPWCTLSNPGQFFSHRRATLEASEPSRSTGRMAACVWIA